MASGAIQRKQIIEDEALRWGTDYANEVAKAVEANKSMLASLVQLNEINQKVKRAENRTEFLKQQNDLRIAYQQTTNALNEQLVAEKNAEKLRQEALRTEKTQLDVESKRATAKKRNTQLTIEERVQNEVNNRALKQQAREALGLVGAYEKLNRRRTEAQKRLIDLLAAEEKNTKAIKAAQKEYDLLDKKVRAIDNAADIYTKNIGNYQSVWKGAGGILRELVGAFGVATGVALFAQMSTAIFNTAKELQTLDLALKNVSDSQADYASNVMFLQNLSKQYGLELQSLTKTYSQFYIAAKDKISAAQIKDIFENISKAASAMGLSVDQQEGAFLALTQMMSKGTVQAEELRGQLGERLPGAFGIMAKSIGVTEVELNKMLKDGKVMANEVLPKFARELANTYNADTASKIETITKNTNRLSNAWTNFVRVLTEGDSAFTKFINGSLKVFAGVVDGITLSLMTDAERRAEQLKFLQQDAYNEYKKSNKEFNNESLNAQIKYNKEQIRENTIMVNAMIAENKRLIAANPGFANGIFSARQENDYKKWIENAKKIKETNDVLAAYVGQNQAMLEELNLRNTKSTTKTTELTKEELEKQKRAREKAAQEYIDMLKKRNQDEFELNKFRLEREIYYNQLIVDDETKTIDERVNAYLQVQQLQKGLLDNELTYNRKSIALNNDTLKEMSIARIDSTVKAANDEANAFLRTGEIVKGATNEQILLYENYALGVQKINDKMETDKQKLIDSEIKIMQEGLNQKLLLQNTELNQSIEQENEIYREALRLAGNNYDEIQKAEQDHQERLFNIKKVYALKALDLQIKELENLIRVNDGKDESERISTEERTKLVNQLAKFKAERNEVDKLDYETTADDKVEIEKQFNQRVTDLAFQLSDNIGALIDAMFQRRIQNIQDEMDKWNSYYDEQIQLAGDDARQKELIEKERDRKQTELERKRRKEEYKAAVAQRIIQLGQITANTAMASTAALAPPPVGLGPLLGASLIPFIIASGAIQAATILATPLPKYKVGRNGGPAELAVTGDGYVNEVLSDPDGSNPIVTPNVPTLTLLKKDQMVHKSLDDYYRFMDEKNLSNKTREAIELHYMFNGGNGSGYDPAILDELRKTRQEIAKGRNVVINNNIDLGYELWRNRNINWRA